MNDCGLSFISYIPDIFGCMMAMPERTRFKRRSSAVRRDDLVSQTSSNRGLRIRRSREAQPRGQGYHDLRGSV